MLTEPKNGRCVECLGRSPGLNPFDYFIWGHMEILVYQTKPTVVHDLQEGILQKTQTIPNESSYNECCLKFSNTARTFTNHSRTTILALDTLKQVI